MEVRYLVGPERDKQKNIELFWLNIMRTSKQQSFMSNESNELKQSNVNWLYPKVSEFKDIFVSCYVPAHPRCDCNLMFETCLNWIKRESNNDYTSITIAIHLYKLLTPQWDTLTLCGDLSNLQPMNSHLKLFLIFGCICTTWAQVGPESTNREILHSFDQVDLKISIYIYIYI